MSWSLKFCFWHLRLEYIKVVAFKLIAYICSFALVSRAEYSQKFYISPTKLLPEDFHQFSISLINAVLLYVGRYKFRYET